MCSQYIDKTVEDFRTKLQYHEYLQDRLYELLSEKRKDLDFVKEYPPGEIRGIDIVGLRHISSGQAQKIMTDISKLLLRSKAPVKVLVFSTKEVRDYMERVKEQNVRKGYLNWADIEFYEANELINKF